MPIPAMVVAAGITAAGAVASQAMANSGGSSTQTVKLPKWLEDAAKYNLDIANEAAMIPYTPYEGPTVAALDPQQIASMKGTNDAAAAFNMPHVNTTGMGPKQVAAALTGLPKPMEDASGAMGYSAAPAIHESINQLPPGVREMIDSFFINPETGRAPTNLSVPMPNSSPATRKKSAKLRTRKPAEPKKQQPQYMGGSKPTDHSFGGGGNM